MANAAKLRPFMGVDGEGGGTDRLGRQNYLLLRAGPQELCTGKRLKTGECLEFICSLPADPLLVGFSFGYDVTMILRDLPEERLDWVFVDKSITAEIDNDPNRWFSRYTFWGDYAIDYVPKNYLRIARVEHGMYQAEGPNGRLMNLPTERVVPGSARTIYETFGFFQQSFLKAIQSFDVGKKHWAMIDRNKENRGNFKRMTKEIRKYNRIECELLAELMESFRKVCYDNGLRPKTWNGAGKISSFLHDKHGTTTAQQLGRLVPDGVLAMAAAAYYGGRFETMRAGEVKGPVYEADIGSAYPAGMPLLPCLQHGYWDEFRGTPPSKGLWLAEVKFTHPDAAPICGLPIRKSDGRLFWPREGRGVYWSPEIISAQRLGTRVKIGHGWRYMTACQCQVFDWVEPLYQQRRTLGKDLRGYPIKLGINSLYGKLAQRIGNPRWSNMVWAGLITAHTRAWLNDAAAQAPADIIMLATDAVFSTRRLLLPYGDGLGQWEVKEHPRLFIVQPGLYFGASRPKTRGVPASLFVKHVERFEADWRTWCEVFAFSQGHSDQFAGYPAGPPIVVVPLDLFTGLRLAYARGKVETAGKWIVQDRKFSFDWTRKRAADFAWAGPYCVVTRPAAGGHDLVSVPHQANAAWFVLDEERMELDEQPDYIDLSPIA